MPSLRARLSPLVLAWIAACNHGGGAAVAPQLGLSSMQPAAGSSVEPGSTVAIVFDREPDPATLLASAFVVADGAGPMAGSVAYDAPARRWTWTPAEALPLGARVTARIGDSVRGRRGETFAAATWTFRVRTGAPSAPTTLDAGSGAAGDDRPFAGVLPDGTAVAAVGGAVWLVDGTGATALPALPTGHARGLCVDGDGDLAVLTVSGTGTGAGVDLCRRAGAGWQAEPVTASGTAFVVDARLLGNEAGDLAVHLRTMETAAPTHATDALFFSGAAAPGTWSSPLSEVLPTGAPAPWRVALDGAGVVGVLHIANGARVEVIDVAHGASDSYALTPAAFPTVLTIAGERAGGLRALWSEPTLGNYERRYTQGSGFAQAGAVAAGALASTEWRSSASGTLVGIAGTAAVRSEATGQWSTATLSREPMAVAVSPRGEAVFLMFTLPDSWWLVRWRAGEDPDAPLRLATVASPYNGLRDGVLTVDGRGVVTAVLSIDASGPLLAVRVE